MSSPRIFLASLAFLAAGCSSTPPQPPPSKPAGPEQDRSVPTSSRPDEPEGAGETVQAVGSTPPGTARSRSGATVLVLEPHATGLEPAAEICICLSAGRAHGRQALAELAVEALVTAAEGASGRPPLRRSVSRLGGSLQTDVGEEQSWVYMRVPPESWEAALESLVRALTEPATTRSRLDRVRADLLAQRAGSLGGDRAHLAVVKELMHGEGGPAEVLQALQDRDPAEILLFQRRYFRPESSLLAISVPEVDTEDVARRASAALDGWTAAALQTSSPVREPLTRAIHWVPGDGPCRAVLLFGLPDPLMGQAASLWLLQECLTMQGVGGRLERALIQSGTNPLFDAEVLTSGMRSWLALSAVVEPEQVPRIWQVARSARESLAAVGPSESELDLGKRRARLSLLSQHRTALRRMQLAIRMTAEGITADPVASQLRQLAAPVPDLAAAQASWIRLPFAMIVVGGQPNEGRGEDDDPIVEHQPATGRAAAGFVGSDARTRIEDARPHLDRALQAMGGPHKVGAVHGYRQVAELHVPDGPTAVERLVLDGNELERVRRVLGTAVTTTVEEGRGTETDGESRSELEPQRVAELMLEANRHPLMLLAAHARGHLLLGLVSLRRVDGRDVAVLEAVRSPYARLRIHIDVRSGLPRIVESWREVGEGPIYVRELYSDFRRAGGIRVPFHRATHTDDGSGRLETVVSEFEPVIR